MGGERPVDIEISPQDFSIIYAITDRHVYRTRDYGPEYLGQSWEKLSADLPTLGSPRFVLAHGVPGKLYAVSENRIFTRRLTQDMWTRGGDFGLGSYAETYPWLVTDPANPERIWVGFKAKYGGAGPLSILQESQDAGTTWSNTMAHMWRVISDKGLPATKVTGKWLFPRHLVEQWIEIHTTSTHVQIACTAINGTIVSLNRSSIF